MSLQCCTDSEYYVTLSDLLVISVGTEFCRECGRMIPCGTGHYKIWEWEENEWGDERHLGQHTCCEVCGDLALSWLELGYCWTYGDLRSNIKEMNEMYGYGKMHDVPNYDKPVIKREILCSRWRREKE